MHKRILGLFLCLASTTAMASEQCIKPKQLVRTAVEISREITVETTEGKAVISAQGTAWFLDSYHVATIEHVAGVMANANEWTTVTLKQDVPWKKQKEHRESIPVRIVGVLNSESMETVVILELQSMFLGLQIADIRETEVLPGEHLVGVGYPNGTLELVEGTYLGDEMTIDKNGQSIHKHLIEVYDGERKPVFVDGSSGSGLYDCDGRLVFVLSTVLAGGTIHVCGKTTESCADEGYDIPIMSESGPTNSVVSIQGISRFFKKNMDKRHAP